MKNKKLFAYIVLAIIFILELSLPISAMAQEVPPDTGFTICQKQAGLSVCIKQIYLLSLGLGSLVAMLMIVLGGYEYMTAGGNAEQVQKGKEHFVSALTGLVILFVAFILLYLINPDLVKFKNLSLPDIPGPKTIKTQ